MVCHWSAQGGSSYWTRQMKTHRSKFISESLLLVADQWLSTTTGETRTCDLYSTWCCSTCWCMQKQVSVDLLPTRPTGSRAHTLTKNDKETHFVSCFRCLFFCGFERFCCRHRTPKWHRDQLCNNKCPLNFLKTRKNSRSIFLSMYIDFLELDLVFNLTLALRARIFFLDSILCLHHKELAKSAFQFVT